ncbi:MAG: serine hydrolase [Ruminococcaceae bacterium]|nr:serine hydrolase [Oscillospiraceae bacterium]
MKTIPEERMKEICSEIDGSYGLYVSLPDEGEVFQLNSHTRLNAASTIKIPIMALLLKDFEKGRLDPEQRGKLNEENRVRGSGVLKVLSHSFELSLYDYAILMMVVSDNSATNHIIDALGIDRVNRFCKENGWNDTHLSSKLFCEKPLLPDGTKDFDYSSAADLGNMMETILREEMVSKEASRTMLQIMATQQVGKFDLSLPVKKHTDPSLPLPPIPEGYVYVANKGGTILNKLLHDAAIILLPNGRRAVITLMTATPDNKKTLEIFKRLSRTLYESLI